MEERGEKGEAVVVERESDRGRVKVEGAEKG